MGTKLIKTLFFTLVLISLIIPQVLIGAAGNHVLAAEPPMAVNDSYSTDNTTLHISAAEGVLDNDTDADGDLLIAIKVSDPTNGTLTLNADGSFTYVHDGSDNTSDSFSYKANDGATDSNVATVNITINVANDPLIASDDAYSVDKGDTLTVAAEGVLANDTSANGNLLTAIKVSDPANGTLTLNADGSFTYVHDGSDNTSDSFSYKANDGTADSNVATANITINGVSDPLAGNGWLDEWDNRLEIAIDHTKIDSTLVHFPVLIHLSSNCGQNGQDVTQIFDEVSANSLKIAVTEDDGESQLYVEVEKWDAVNEEAWLWTSRAGWSISDSANTTLYLYYDNDQPDNTAYVGEAGDTAARNVWDSSFRQVLHMSSSLIDSTGKNNGGTLQYGDKETADYGTTISMIKERSTYRLNYRSDHYNGWTCEITSGPAQGEKRTVTDYVVYSVRNDKSIYLDSPITGLASGNTYWLYKSGEFPAYVAGDIGGAVEFNGEDQWISATGLSRSEIAGDKLTLEVIMNPDTLANRQCMLCKNGPFMFYLYGNKLDFAIYTGVWTHVTGNTSLSAQLMYLTGVYDGTSMKVYEDGVFDNQTGKTGYLQGEGQNVIGIYNNVWLNGHPAYHFDGKIDEIRITKGVRNDAWIKATYYTCWDDLLSYSAPSHPPWSFAIITDLHIGREVEDYDGPGWEDSSVGQEDIASITYLRQAVELINSNKQKYNIELVVVLGDISESAELSQLNKAKEILNGLEIPWVPLIGNHDVWPFYGANPDPTDPYAEMAPEVGPNNAGTDIYFDDKFQSQYQILSNKFQNWEKAGIPVWNPEVAPEHNSYFQNFAFDYNGYHFIGMDFNARDNAPWPWKGVAPEGDLHNFTGGTSNGTWVWFTNYLQQYLAEYPESEENIILLAHHPFNSGRGYFDGFSVGELNIMYNFLRDYQSNIYAEFAGHTHQNIDRWSRDNIMRVIETNANFIDTQVRIVQISPVGEIDYSKFLPENGIVIKAFSPVDLVITDPDNLTISKELNEIPGATYTEIHLDGDGILDDLIQISERKIGEYTIEVIPEPGANPTDTYTIDVSTIEDSFGWVPVIVADNVTIEATPTEPYRFKSAVRKPTQLTYTGDLSGVYSAPVNLCAVLVDENGAPLPERMVTFEIGNQSASAVTDENGLASTTLTLEQAPGRYYFIDAYCGGDEDYLPALDYKPFEIKTPATIDFDPDTLNLKGQGQWITAYIELPASWDVADIDLSAVLLNGVLPAVSDPQYGFVTDPASYITDNDGDGILERMVKFDREAVKQLVNVEEDLEEVPGGLQGEIQLTVSGSVAGTGFEGNSIILVILKGK